MLYFSTRDPSRSGKPFSEVVLEGLAPDGGLYLPLQIPTLDDSTLQQWSQCSYKEIAVKLLELYAPELRELPQLIDDSTRHFRNLEVTPLKALGESSLYIGELFHGPTYAFKDVALQFLGQVFQGLLARQGRKLILLGATSGDTGGAAIYGVRSMKNILLTVLHPHNGISEIQRRQMCSVTDENIQNIAIYGNFDQCQSIVKELMERSKSDPKLPHLGAINSINWGRILAQISYYFALYFRLVARRSASQLGDPVRFVVPTGNFGNVLAGYFAKQMGLPIKLVAVSNRNAILHQCIAHNHYQPAAEVQPSLAPAMDIVQPSNFERYLWYLYEGDSAKVSQFVRQAKAGALQQFSLQQYAQLQEDFQSYSAGDQEILQAICHCYQEFGYVLDPHSACAFHVSSQWADDAVPSINLATAHPAKFPEVFRGLEQEFTGLDPSHKKRLVPRLEIPPGLDLCTPEGSYHILQPESELILQHLQQFWLKNR